MSTSSTVHETFHAYVRAASAASTAFEGYHFGYVSEYEVHRAQRAEAEAHAAHVDALDDLTAARPERNAR